MDMEHAPLSVEKTYSMVQVAERSGMAALVRLRGHDIPTGATLMDAGASGVLIPHCSPYETAKELITDLVLPPKGRRGSGGGGRSTQWLLEGHDEYRRGDSEGVVRVPMIEDPEAVDQIDDILNIHGVDAIFIGTGDLTASLNGDREQVKVLVDKALKAAIAKGIPAATTAYGADLPDRIKMGFKWIAIQSDTSMFTTAASERIKWARQQVEAAG
jgi:2-keto-3-deoxy-L-rhamnonate aldolase RhmA